MLREVFIVVKANNIEIVVSKSSFWIFSTKFICIISLFVISIIVYLYDIITLFLHFQVVIVVTLIINI